MSGLVSHIQSALVPGLAILGLKGYAVELAHCASPDSRLQTSDYRLQLFFLIKGFKKMQVICYHSLKSGVWSLKLRVLSLVSADLKPFPNK